MLFLIIYIYCTWKNIRKQYENRKLRIIAPTWMMNLNYYMVLILFQIFSVNIEYIIKEHETLTTTFLFRFTSVELIID